MRAQLESHLSDINRTADVAHDPERSGDAIDLVVVTDSEAILGIGGQCWISLGVSALIADPLMSLPDQGVGGITISTSKAALYTLGAGINPNRILPVVLDVGTDNHALFSDPLYMGWKRTRLCGRNYDGPYLPVQTSSSTINKCSDDLDAEFVDRFIRNCRQLFPNAIIHFEDFGMANAHRFMGKYKDIPMFNDDIQGTGAVALAALIA